MTPSNPLTAAWSDVRELTAATADQHRQAGHTVIEAVSDHATVQDVDGAPVTFLFTVMDSVATELMDVIDDGMTFQTEVQYVDVDGVRLFVLHISADGVRVLLAGGIQHDALVAHVEAPDESGRVAVRRADGALASQFTVDRVAPFIVGLEQAAE